MPETPWRVTHATWLTTELERVKSILLVPKFWHRAWTVQSLKEALGDIGLVYSIPQLQEINDELHRLGIVEDVPESEPAPP